MTVAHELVKGTPVSGPPLATREDCLKFLGTLRAAEWLRECAARPETVTAAAADAGVTEDLIRAKMLALADGIDELTAEGITPPDCWRILGWTVEFVHQVLGIPMDGAR